MKKLLTFNFSEGPQAGMLKGLLEAEDIPCTIFNERLFTAMGEIPFTECFPELWILNDEDLPRAEGVIDGWQNVQARNLEPWICPECGETVEGDFAVCWNCGCEYRGGKD